MGVKPGGCAASMPSRTSSTAKAAAHALEDLRVQAVEAHGDAIQARGLQFGGVAFEQDAIGGQRDILDAGDAGEVADQIGEVRAQQRFAAGEPDLVTPCATNSRASRRISSKDRRSRGFQEPVALVELLRGMQ